jgi:isoleucyl-tRNA synthetase
VRLVAPILTFTADEVWEQLPPVAGREISVHLARFPKPEEIFSENPALLINEWKILFALREAVLSTLEELRQKKVIGKSLEADLEIFADNDMLTLLRDKRESLKEFFNVSGVRLPHFQSSRLSEVKGLTNSTRVNANMDLQAYVLPASGQKCARCWNFMPDTADYGIWQNVCGRCRTALTEMGIAPPNHPADEDLSAGTPGPQEVAQ